MISVGLLCLRWSSVVSEGLRSLRWSPWSPVVSSGLRGLLQSPVIFGGHR